MSAINFDELFDELKNGVEAIAKDMLNDYENEAKEDGKQALENVKDNLQQWTKDLETGAINAEDLKFLLQEDEELNKMIALKQAGLAEIHLDEFRNNIINMIINTITGWLKA